MTAFSIRPAETNDASAACEVLRRSITELCAADHRDDPAVLELWLANKKPETLRGWIAAPDHTLLLAERDGAVVGVGGVADAGVVTLNYVAPGARFAGVSTALLTALEDRSCRQGVCRSRLSSTATARGFYRRRGYVDAGQSVVFGRMTHYHMAKQLHHMAKQPLGNP